MSTTLKQAIETLYPEESAARESEAAATEPDMVPMISLLRVSADRVLLPGQRMVVDATETMSSIVHAGSDGRRQIGVIGCKQRNGCIAEVVEGPSGTLELLGVRRFRTVFEEEPREELAGGVAPPQPNDDSSWMIPGSGCAMIAWEADPPICVGQPEEQSARTIGRELLETLDKWTEWLVESGERNPRDDLGPAPPLSSPEALGMWAVALLNPACSLGVAPEVRQRALDICDSVLRLQLALEATELSLEYLRTGYCCRPIQRLPSDSTQEKSIVSRLMLMALPYSVLLLPYWLGRLAGIIPPM